VGADRVFAMPHARIAVMGPGGGSEFVFKQELREVDASYKQAIKDGLSSEEAARLRDLGLAQIRERYERELLNPREALALGSVSSIVMPGTSRRVLAKNLAFLMRTYRPSPMSGPQRESE
jgi:acetyl-CoA carboxylase carboxyltransferase component